MMSYLPEDVVEEILSRVPAISLKRLRSTCKRWNALFKDPIFIDKHLRKAAKQFRIAMFKEHRICSLSVNLNVAVPSIEFKGALDLKDLQSNSNKQVDISQVFHCDGLLLCTTEDKILVVWNPCTGETKWLQLKIDYLNGGSYKFSLGYQNNNSCRSYKILKCWNKIGGYPIFEIYEFGSDTWTVLDNNNPNFCLLGYAGVSLKGNSYWLALDASEYCLLCFDFTTKRFRRLCLPPFSYQWFCEGLSIVREEQLSVVIHKWAGKSKMEIWLTNKFDTEGALLWSKFVTVDLHKNVCGSLLIDQEKKVALCWNERCDSTHDEKKIFTIGEDNKYYTDIPYNDKPWTSFIFSYVPSLVQIQKGRGKREE